MRIQSEKYVHNYIMDALFSLMSIKKYDEITITEIIKKAGVGKMSFYRNFTSKDNVIEQWISNTTNNFLKTSDISFKNDSSKDYFIKLFNHLEKYKNPAILIYKANLTHLLKNEFESRILKIYEKEYGSYKSYFLAGGIFNVYYYWLMNGCKESPDTIANKLVDFIQK